MEPSYRQIISPYERDAERLADQYDSVSFEQVHADLLGWIPKQPAFVLDVGAGSGRDAAWFADRGHEIVAVEPAGAPATTIMFRAAQGDDLSAGRFGAPISRIYVFQQGDSRPQTEIRLTSNQKPKRKQLHSSWRLMKSQI